MADEPEFIVEYVLAKPIKAFDEELAIIKLRKPTGADLIRVGNPVLFYPHADPIKIEHDMPKMVTMMSRLSGIPVASLERMSTEDLLGIAWSLSPFFIPPL